jgi:hypothetical protein
MNPIRKYSSNVFASRGCDIDEAMQDAFDTIQRINESDRAHAMTALMVLVNTAANAFDQAQGPSPEKLAIINLIRTEIDNWASSNFEAGVEAWFDNNVDIGEKIQEHMNDNVDIDNSISEWMNEYLESHVSEAIDNLDLVVRVR